MNKTILLYILICLFPVFGWAQRYEAEMAQLSGTLKVGTAFTGFSGSGYVGEFAGGEDKLTFNIDNLSPGTYTLSIGYYCMYDTKKNYVSINGNRAEFEFPKNNTFSPCTIGKVSIGTGKTVIEISKSWGYFVVDYIEFSPASATSFNIDSDLVTPQPSKETKALYDYLKLQFGKKLISGQTGDNEAEQIGRSTGKEPAIRAYDFMDYSPSRLPYGAKSEDTEKAIAWHKQGGIVTIAWHWNAPKDLIDNEAENIRWWSGFYTYATTFDVEYAMANPLSEEYALIIRDLDAIAVQLKKLQEAGVPVLWRPLHEAAGKWFWWGAKGAAPCKKLYHLMYDRYVNYHNLKNLIWVWTSDNAADALDWYPGDEYVDIIGADIYEQGNHSSHSLYFEKLKDIYKGRKILAISENGSIADPEAMKNDEAMWSYFVTWSGEFITEKHNSAEFIRKVYQNENVINLEDYPSEKEFKIVRQPQSVIVFEGDNVRFDVLARGIGLSYQWYHDNKMMPDSKSFELLIPNSTLQDAGLYYCVVKNQNQQEIISEKAELNFGTEKSVFTEDFEADHLPSGWILTANAQSSFVRNDQIKHGISFSLDNGWAELFSPNIDLVKSAYYTLSIVYSGKSGKSFLKVNQGEDKIVDVALENSTDQTPLQTRKIMFQVSENGAFQIGASSDSELIVDKIGLSQLDLVNGINPVYQQNRYFVQIYDSELNVTSDEEIEGLTLYDITGKIICRSMNNKLSINHLRGVYILKIELANKEIITNKICIH